MANTLSIEHLRKVYGKREVVKDISFSMRGGEIVGLLGPNGAGKTTTFYMIVGFIANNGGRISINGIDITEHGYEFQYETNKKMARQILSMIESYLPIDLAPVLGKIKKIDYKIGYAKQHGIKIKQ